MAEPGTFDIAVYGGTAGGVLAAVAAARQGLRVALLEPGRHVGGMVSGGLGWTDVGNRDVIGGLALAFYDAVAAHYGVARWDVLGPEPHVAEAIFRDWLHDAGVTMIFGAEVAGVARNKRAIARLITTDERALAATVFIDASYEGELLAQAGVSSAVGRESVSLYGESWAGRQPSRPDRHNFRMAVSPFVNGRDGALLPLMHDRPLVAEGEGDGGVQSYCFRLCLTDDPENRLPFPPPEDYDPAEFELVRRFLVAAGPDWRLNEMFGLAGRLPNGKVDVNSIGPISTNLLDGSNWAYPEADPRRRRAIWEHHLRYTQGLLYFLANDPGVPPAIRSAMNQWGLCRDEFADTGHWPHQLYVREARRMIGEYVLTQHDLDAGRRMYDAIALGSYNIDIREVQRTWMWVSHFTHLAGEVFNEGYLSIPVPAYEIPYRALLPRYDQCTNLLVPVCLSASHVAFSSVRMEPQYMMLGHAAGVAAALAVRDGVAVHQIDVQQLRRELAMQGQLLAAQAVQ